MMMDGWSLQARLYISRGGDATPHGRTPWTGASRLDGAIMAGMGGWRGPRGWDVLRCIRMHALVQVRLPLINGAGYQ